MKTTLFRNLLATLVALFAALLALPQPVQAQTKNTITIDGVKKEILSTDFQKDPHDKHGFMVFFFLSEDKNEFLGIMGNEKLHAFYDSFSLDRYESKHLGKSYWGIAYQRKGKILFQSSGHPDLGRVHFRRGELRIDGHPRPDRSVCSFQLRDGEIIDAKHGDGKKHTLSIDYRHDREAPTAGKLNVGTVDKTSISLSWTPATDEVTPTDKMHYVVEYQRMGGHGWMMLPVKSATSYTIKELTPDTEYRVNIRALDESGNYIRYDEQTITTKSETTIYDLHIAGTEVTSANCNDLSVIDGVSGTVTYDPDTKTLTLDNATIKTTETKSWGHCISNQIDGLNIHLIGNNAFTSEQSGLIYNDDDKQMTFTGEGKLTLSSGLTVPEGFRYGIRNRGHILVKDCHLEISTEGSALLRGAWEFDNCHVRAKGNAEGSIVHLKAEPTFKGCSITSPQHTVWKSIDAEYFLQDADGKNVTDWVEISPKPTSAQTLRTDAPTRCGIFTLTGVRLDTSFNRLPAGVYIVDGKKMVKP